MLIRVQLIGAKELEKLFKSSAPKILNKAVRKGLRAGAKIIQLAAIAAAPRRTGALARDIKVRAAKRSRKGGIAVNVSIGNKAFVGKRFYGAFQELGWNAKGRGKRKEKGRPIAGKHFIRNASKAVGPAAAQVVVNETTKALEAMRA